MGGQVAETQLLWQNGDHRLQCAMYSGRLKEVYTKDSTSPGCVGASQTPRNRPVTHQGGVIAAAQENTPWGSTG